MIKDFGAKHVIVGHSERRSLYGETSEIVAEKTKAAIDKLKVIFCIGENKNQKKKKLTNSILKKSFTVSPTMYGFTADTKASVMVEMAAIKNLSLYLLA